MLDYSALHPPIDMKYFFFCTMLLISFALPAQTVQKRMDEALRLAEQGLNHLALLELDKIAKDSFQARTYGFMAELQLGLQDYPRAKKTLTNGIQQFPEDGILHGMRGFVNLEYLNSGELAVLDYEKAIALVPNDTMKHNLLLNLSAAKITIMDFDGAYADAYKAHLFDSTNVAVLVNLANVCDEVGRGEETLMYLEKAVRLDPSFYPIYGNMGFKHQRLGDHEKAVELYNKVLEFDPEEPLGYSNRAYSRLKTGDTNGAMRDINKSIRLLPTNSYAYMVKGEIFLELGENELACEEFHKAIEYGFDKRYGTAVDELIAENCGG